MKSGRTYCRVLGFALAGLLGLSGCATTAPDTGAKSLSALRLALTAPVNELRARAEAGDAQAQYGLSVLTARGLRGVPVDLERSANWRQRAMAVRGSTQITQYIAGLNGSPGRVAMLNVPRYELNASDAAANDKCAAMLFAWINMPLPVIADAAASVCGGMDSALELRDLAQVG